MSKERRLQFSSILIITGLISEAISIIWFHPLTFLAFICIGGLTIGVGILCYLSTLLAIE